MSFRRFASFPLALAAMALASCGDEDETASGPASFAPTGAPIYLEVSRESDEQVANAEALIAELGEVPLLGSPLDPRELIEQAIDESAADEGVDISFAADIEPWLGNRAALAFMSLEQLITPSEAGESSVIGTETDPDFVAVIEVSDEAIASDSIDRLLAADDSTEVVEDDVGGQTVKRLEGEEGGVAVVDGFLVFGSTDAALEQAFGAHDGESLDEAEEFADSIGGVPAERLAAGYVDLGGIFEASVAEGDIEAAELDAVRALYGDAFDQPLTLALTAGERALALDVSGAAALAAGTPGIGSSELLSTAPGDAFAAVGVPDVGGQAQSLVEIVEASGGLFGEPGVTPGTVSEGFEAEVGVPLDTVTEALGDAVVHVRGELPGGYVIGAELALLDEGLPSQVYDFVGEQLRNEGFKTGAPLDRAGTGFSAESRAAAPGKVGFLNVDIQPGAAVVTLAPDRQVAENLPPQGALGDEELFGAAAAALGAEFEPAAFADLGPILDAVLGESSLLDVATGEASAERAIAGFLADKLGFAALGTREEGDRLVQRLVVGLR